MIQHAKKLYLKESGNKKEWTFNLEQIQLNNFKTVFNQMCEDGVNTVESINFYIKTINEQLFDDIGEVLSKFNKLTFLEIDQSQYSTFNPAIFSQLSCLKHLTLKFGTSVNGEAQMAHVSYALQKVKSLESIVIQIGESRITGQFCDALGASILNIPNLLKFSFTVLSFNSFDEKNLDLLSQYLCQHNSLQEVDLSVKYCNRYTVEDSKSKQNITRNLNLSNTILKAKVDFEYYKTLEFEQVKVRQSNVVQIVAIKKHYLEFLINHLGMILSDLYY